MLLVETPSRAATSETGYPCSLICFTASILNSSVKFLADINTPSLSLHYEAKKCLRNPGLFKHKGKWTPTSHSSILITGVTASQQEFIQKGQRWEIARITNEAKDAIKHLGVFI